MKSRGRRIFWWLNVVILLGLVWPQPVLAHAGLVRATPADICTSLESPQLPPGDPGCSTGKILAEAPTSIHLWFSEPVQTVRHGILVIAPSGQHAEQGPIQANGLEVAVEIQATEQGTYQVYWQVMSEDTHPVRGQFAFSVGQPSPVTNRPTLISPELGAVSGLGLILQVAGRWLHFAGYALAFGPLIFSWLVLRPLSLTKEAASQEHRLGKLVNWGIVLLLIAEPVALLGQTASLGTSQLFDLDLLGDILSSSFGRVLGQRLAAAVLLWILVGTVRQGTRQGIIYIGGLGLILALIDGQASHAVTSGPLALGLILNTLHLAAMGVWLGGLVSLLVVLIGQKEEMEAGQRLKLVDRFGRVAGVCLLWLAISGSVMAWLHLNQPIDLLNTAYGKTLALKLVGLLGVVCIAFWGYRRRKIRPLRWWIAEAGLLAGVVGLAGLLISLPPPA